jgi:hypothetical protein
VLTRAAGFPTRTSSTTRFNSRSTDMAACSREEEGEPLSVPLAARLCCGCCFCCFCVGGPPEARRDHADMTPPIVTKSSSVSSPSGYASKSSRVSVASSSHPSFLENGIGECREDEKKEEDAGCESFSSSCEENSSQSSWASRLPLSLLMPSILILIPPTRTTSPWRSLPSSSSSSSSSCHCRPRICDSGDAIAGDSSWRSGVDGSTGPAGSEDKAESFRRGFVLA